MCFRRAHATRTAMYSAPEAAFRTRRTAATRRPTHLGRNSRPLHRDLGFSRAVVVQASCHGTDNSALLEALAASDGAWRGVAMVDADVSERELERLHAGGVRGVRFNFVAHLGGAPDTGVVTSVVERIAALGWHLQLHLDRQSDAALLGLNRIEPQNGQDYGHINHRQISHCKSSFASFARLRHLATSDLM